MSELRQNLMTREWVIIAPERGKKPRKFKPTLLRPDKTKEKQDPSCPFCPGNEERFPVSEIDRIPDRGSSEWKVRVIENKYKVLDAFPECPIQPARFHQDGIYQKTGGCGSHELVIDHAHHHQHLTTMTKEETHHVIEAYRKRYLVLEKNPNNLLTIIFKNYGAAAGASQPHPHSQIVGSRVVPIYVRSLLHEAEAYFDQFGVCVFCEILRFELEHKERTVLDNSDFLAFVPYAAGMPHEVMILPKKHHADFGSITENEEKMLAEILQGVLRRIQQALGDPDFNYVIRTAPYPLSRVPFYHWHLHIYPQTNIPGGFELGTQIRVNPIFPEESADLLRATSSRA